MTYLEVLDSIEDEDLEEVFVSDVWEAFYEHMGETDIDDDDLDDLFDEFVESRQGKKAVKNALKAISLMN